MNIFKKSIFVMMLLLGQNAQAMPSKAIQEYFKALPVTAFDDTTEGLTEEDKLQLLQKQESSTWKLQKVSEQKIIITSKVPTSVVTLRVKMLEQELLEVKTQNEQVLKLQYWAFGTDGKLVQVYPKVWVMAANAVMQEQDQVNLALVPEDVQHFIETQSSCHHWEGEEAYDAERAKMIQDAMLKLGCETLPAKEAALRKTHVGKPQILQILDQAKLIIE